MRKKLTLTLVALVALLVAAPSHAQAVRGGDGSLTITLHWPVAADAEAVIEAAALSLNWRPTEQCNANRFGVGGCELRTLGQVVANETKIEAMYRALAAQLGSQVVAQRVREAQDEAKETEEAKPAPAPSPRVVNGAEALKRE